MLTFADYKDIPAPARDAMFTIESLLGDLDGKTLCTETRGEGDDRGFIDEGTVVIDDYIGPFNRVVEVIKTLQWVAEKRSAQIIAFADALNEARDALEMVRDANKSDPHIPPTALAAVDAAHDKATEALTERDPDFPVSDTEVMAQMEEENLRYGRVPPS